MRPDAREYPPPAKRLSGRDLERQLEAAAEDPRVQMMLAGPRGLGAVLNGQRQLLACNVAFQRCFGTAQPQELLGLRLGDAVGCLHADEGPDGCGTGRNCPRCGHTLALVEALLGAGPVEHTWDLSFRTGAATESASFALRATHDSLGEPSLLWLWAEETSARERQRALTRRFFHDVRNTANALAWTVEGLKAPQLAEEDLLDCTATLERLAKRMSRAVDMEDRLGGLHRQERMSARSRTSVGAIVRELVDLVQDLPPAQNRELVVDCGDAKATLETDLTAVLCILTHMVLNAFEAERSAEPVRLNVERTDHGITFAVWSRPEIPLDVAHRVFESFFTTKTGTGRGLGTYTMRLLGQTLLGGSVDFTTSAAHGTTFRFFHPC